MKHKIKAHVIHGEDERADQLIKASIKLYNAENFEFTSTLSNRENLMICCFLTERGGLVGSLIMDTAHNKETFKVVTMCQILVVDKGARGQGVARDLVRMAQAVSKDADLEFAGAYVEADQFELWEKLGFPHQGNIGFSMTKTFKPLSELLGE